MFSKRYIYILILFTTTIIIIIYYNKQETMNINIITNYSALNLSDESNKLFDLELKYAIKSNVCKLNPKLLAIIIVTSYFGNVEVRSAMRRIFPNKLLLEWNIQRVFLLGLNNNDKYMNQKAIFNEGKRFRDLIQGNFQEAYRNLTYKHLMGLKWASTDCAHVKYIVKMDDDIVVDMYKLKTLLLSNNLSKESLMGGYVLKNMKPIRIKANKWFVTEEEYDRDVYPTFLSGWFYITNPQTSKKIIALTKYEPYFWIDDTYITGVLAEMINIQHIALNDKFTLHSEYFRCCMNDILQNSINCEFLVGPNGGDNNLFYDFNNITAMCYRRDCKERFKPINETCVSERKINVGRGSSLIETYRLT